MAPPPIRSIDQNTAIPAQLDYFHLQALQSRYQSAEIESEQLGSTEVRYGFEMPNQPEPPWRPHDQFFGHDEAFGRWVFQYKLHHVNVGDLPKLYPSYLLLRTTKVEDLPKVKPEQLKSNGHDVISIPPGSSVPKTLHTLRNAFLLSLWGLGPTCYGYLKLPNGDVAMVMDEIVDAISLRSQDSARAYPKELQERINQQSTKTDLKAILDFFKNFRVSVDGQEDYLLLPDGRLQVTEAQALSLLSVDRVESLILRRFDNYMKILELLRDKTPPEPPAKVGGLLRRNGHDLFRTDPVRPARIPELSVKRNRTTEPAGSIQVLKSGTASSQTTLTPMASARRVYSARPTPARRSFFPRTTSGRKASLWHSGLPRRGK